jgi:hypothetical protein
VVASGPAGSANPAVVTYSPPGYNHVYRTWNVTAGATNTAFNFNVASGSYKSPVFVIKGYTAMGAPASVTRNAAAMVAGTDYAASVDDIKQECWITVLSSLSGNNAFVVTPGSPNGVRLSGLTATPSTVQNDKATSVTFSVSAEAVGGTLSSVTIDLSPLGGGAAVAMTKGTGTTYSVTYSVPAGTAGGAKAIVVKATDSNSNQKTVSANVTVQNPETTFDIYSDVAADPGVIGWFGNGTSAGEVSTGAYEGTKCIDFKYAIAGYWASMIMMWDNWTGTVDATGYTKLRFAYKGPASGLTAAVKIVCVDTLQNANLSSVNYSAAWAVAEMNLPSTLTSPIKTITFALSGSAVQTSPPGDFFVDKMQLVGHGTVKAIPMARVAVNGARSTLAVRLLEGRNLSISTQGKGNLSLYHLNGRLAATRSVSTRAAAVTSWTIPAAGVYYVKFADESGSVEIERAIVR